MDSTQRLALSRFSAMVARFFAIVRRAARHVTVRRTERILRVCETLPLGERRFLLLVECNRRRYLIGTAAQGISLIDRLDERAESGVDENHSAEMNSWKGLH